MPIVYANAEERRRGGWLTRAEGRVKTKGLPVGPRSPELKRILEGPDAGLLLKAPNDAIDPRCAKLAGKIGNAQRALATLRRQYDEANREVDEAAKLVAQTWKKVRDSLIGPDMADIAKNFWQLVRSNGIIARLLAIPGSVVAAIRIIGMVNEGYELENKLEAWTATRDAIGKDRDETENELDRFVAEKIQLGCP